MRRNLAALCIAATCALAQDEPIFRGQSRLVQIDVIVRNKAGFVHGLTKDHFTVEDDGKRQTIAAFSGPAERRSPTPLPPGTVSNRLTSSGEESRGVTVLLIDRLNTPIELQPFVYHQIRQLVRERAGKDRVAIYDLGNSLRVVHEFTGDARSLEAAVNGLTPETVVLPFAITPEAFLPMMRYVVATLTHAIEDIAHHLEPLPGRKNLVWITTAFPIRMNTSRISFDFSQQIARSLQVASDAHIAVYPLDARGLTTGASIRIDSRPGLCQRSPTLCTAPPQEPPNLATMNFFADHTGGRSFYNTNGIALSIAKVADDGAEVYTLGFYPAESTLDGKFHKLRVRVAAPGAEVRARPTYLAEKEPPVATSVSLETLLTAGLDATAIGLTGRAAPGDAGLVVAAISADVRDLRLDLKDGFRTGTVNIAVTDGTSLATIARPVRLSEVEFAEAISKPFGLTWQIPVPVSAASQTLRVAVQDSGTGAAGSLYIPIATR